MRAGREKAAPRRSGTGGASGRPRGLRRVVRSRKRHRQDARPAHGPATPSPCVAPLPIRHRRGTGAPRGKAGKAPDAGRKGKGGTTPVRHRRRIGQAARASPGGAVPKAPSARRETGPRPCRPPLRRTHANPALTGIGAPRGRVGKTPDAGQKGKGGAAPVRHRRRIGQAARASPGGAVPKAPSTGRKAGPRPCRPPLRRNRLQVRLAARDPA